MTEINKIEKEIDNKDSQVKEGTKDNTSKDEKKSYKEVDITDFIDAYNETERKFNNSESLADHLDQWIVINGYEMGQGAYGPFIVLNVSVDGIDKRLHTSAKPVREQVLKIKDHLPVKTKPIKKIGKSGKTYYTLS